MTSEEKELFQLATTKVGADIAKLATQTVSIKTSFNEYHSALAKIKKDLDQKKPKKSVWVVECRGETDLYLFVAKTFKEVRDKIAALPDKSDKAEEKPAKKKKK